MNISSGYANSINSIQQALSMVNLRNAVNQNAATVEKLIESTNQSSRQQLEKATISHKGQNVDTWG
ncbi:hypothetical protein [Sporohalobacter salinus]|uniref:hypothetical protein n=1 Tax=Sporohalobacter salinus TaxID=1494606 RepID=UPI0019612CEA|nr:hypothetical protein [Sporohalobacter salinus]MBM7623239.1 malonyl CoA-acyl carrier protein transacylase [Sporohalobacter salinus]